MAREEMKVERVDAAIGKTPLRAEGGFDQSPTASVQVRVPEQLHGMYSRRRKWRQRRLCKH